MLKILLLAIILLEFESYVASSMNVNDEHRRIVYGDLSSIAPEHYTKHITTRLTEIKAVESPADRSIFIQMLESTYRFTLGSVAGGKNDLVFL